MFRDISDANTLAIHCLHMLNFRLHYPDATCGRNLRMTFNECFVAGGTFALYSLLCRYMDIGSLSSKRVNSNSTLYHASLNEGSRKQSRLGKYFEKSVVARRLLFFIAILGMCMLIGDGILTPAISGL